MDDELGELCRKVKGYKDPRWKEDMKPLVLVEEVQGWMWKMQKDNQ